MTERRFDSAEKARRALRSQAPLDPITAPVEEILEIARRRHEGSVAHLSVEPLRLPTDERVWAEFACVLAEALTGVKQARRGLWVVFGTLSQSRRGPYISEFSIAALLPDKHLPQEVDARVLRLVRPAEILARARIELEIESDLVERGYLRLTQEELEDLRAAATMWTRDGGHARSPRLGADFYEKFARRYLDLYEAGWSKGILRELARDLGLPEKGMSDRVSHCRDLQFLGPGKQGRAGAEPGPRLPDRGSV
jgi:hypothetical protein